MARQPETGDIGGRLYGVGEAGLGRARVELGDLGEWHLHLAGEAPPRLSAVEITPVPIGLVRMNVSPARTWSIAKSRSGCAMPTTAIPYLGERSSMVWPPNGQPAEAATCAPPRNTSPSSSIGRSSAGHAVRFTAMSGRPPMA